MSYEIKAEEFPDDLVNATRHIENHLDSEMAKFREDEANFENSEALGKLAVRALQARLLETEAQFLQELKEFRTSE